MPADVCKAVAIARLIALRETDGGVGLYATRPFQSMPQARAGTDALAAHVRPAFATRRGAVLVSLDGRSAYDSMSRAAFLKKLREVTPEWIPFVRLFYGSPSTYCWWDSAGRCRDVPQGEGCERGDALAPVLFAFGQHDGSIPTTASSLSWTTSMWSRWRPGLKRWATICGEATSPMPNDA